jgi:hypothetical protein
MAAVARMGLETGKKTRLKMATYPQPSMIAASDDARRAVRGV